MISDHFLKRPVLAGVCSIVIVLAGLAAYAILPLAQYPDIVPPTVVVSASYPGASAETLARTVAAPIEEQLSGAEGLLYFSSTASSNGQLAITITFDTGTNIDTAIFEVTNRVRLAEPRLPEEVRRNGLTVLKRTSELLLFAALTSPDESLSTLDLSNYASINMVDELKRVPGVADLTIFGARDYSMRIWLQPDKMSQLGVTTTDVANALRAQNAQYAAGKIGGEPAPPGQALALTVNATGRLVEPEQFGDIIVRAGGPAGVLRIKDIARVELGAQNYEAMSILDGKPMVGLGLFLQTGANALDVADAVKAKLEELKQKFPPGMDYVIVVDSTDFVKESISEVTQTIFEAALLVIAVVFLFLQSWRATLIPFIAVPVSLIGTFAGLYALGMSINTLTLFAMVLAIGIVVDDAIVVLENVERLMRENGMRPAQAAGEAMREVSGAIVAIVLVLCSVFVPVAFLGGMAGLLYRQFAVTVSIAVVISGFVALTLTPVLCALLLHKEHKELPLFRPFNTGFAWLTQRFLSWVQFVLAHRWKAFGMFGVVVAIAGVLLLTIPRSFLPPEDQGQVMTSVQLPDAATLERTLEVTRQLRELIKDEPTLATMSAVNGVDLIGGGNKTSAATVFVRLKHWDERDTSADDLAATIMQKGEQIPEAVIRAFGPPPIRGLGSAGGFEFYVQARSDVSPVELEQTVQQLLDKLNAHPKLEFANTYYRATVPQLRVDVEREKALALGVPVDDVFETLQATMGALYVNDFNKFGRTYRVQLQADAKYRSKPEDLGNVYVRSTTTGEMIPLKAIITVSEIVGPEQLERFNGFIAAKVIGNGKPGVSSGEAIRAVEEVARETLPDGYELAWSGQAFQELRTGSASVFAFSAAIVMIFLILAALYERWRLPFAVVMAVPFAVAGALALVWLRGKENDIYFQIGLIVLIGLSAKNAILIVEFAQQGFLAGKSAFEAAVEAARLRFRPIVMTSLAFILGVAPLAISGGAGSAARQSMGTGVIGGMLVSTFIATIFVPMFFVLVTGKSRVRRYDVEQSAGEPDSLEASK
ncbi:MAG TPA: multidrug efflux RND transporter permease subunit [Steroidobacteraceae bacterium]